jgi:hypothetical protein
MKKIKKIDVNKLKKINNFQKGGQVIDPKGYLTTNLLNFTPKKIIEGDDNGTIITTNGMAFPILANGKKLFPNTGEYRFKEPFVEEIPLLQKEINIDNKIDSNMQTNKSKFKFKNTPKGQLGLDINADLNYPTPLAQGLLTGVSGITGLINRLRTEKENRRLFENLQQEGFTPNPRFYSGMEHVQNINPIMQTGGTIQNKQLQLGGLVSNFRNSIDEFKESILRSFSFDKKDDDKLDPVDNTVPIDVNKKGKKFDTSKNLVSTNKSINLNSLNKGIQKYGNIIQEAANNYGVPKNLLTGLLYQESRFNPNIQGPQTKYGRARGIAQFIDATAIEEGVNQFDPNSAIPGAARYLKKLYNKTGDWNLALASYNAGYGNVKKHKGIPPFKETIDYVSIINKVANHLNNNQN